MCCDALTTFRHVNVLRHVAHLSFGAWRLGGVGLRDGPMPTVQPTAQNRICHLACVFDAFTVRGPHCGPILHRSVIPRTAQHLSGGVLAPKRYAALLHARTRADVVLLVHISKQYDEWVLSRPLLPAPFKAWLILCFHHSTLRPRRASRSTPTPPWQGRTDGGSGPSAPASAPSRRPAACVRAHIDLPTYASTPCHDMP